MNDVNLAPGNTGNPIKGATSGDDTQALGGGKVAGISPARFLWFISCCAYLRGVLTAGFPLREARMRYPSVGGLKLNITSLPGSHFYFGKLADKAWGCRYIRQQ